MLRTALAIALTAFTLLPVACSSSNSGSGSGSDGGGSGSGGTSGPSRSSATCAEAATAVEGSATLTAGSWGNLPVSFQQTPTSGTFCGTIITGDGGGLTGAITVILSSDWDAQIFDFYNPLSSKGGCTLAAMTTTTGEFATSGTTFTCPGGGLGTITASPSYDFLFLTYSPGT